MPVDEQVRRSAERIWDELWEVFLREVRLDDFTSRTRFSAELGDLIHGWFQLMPEKLRVAAEPTIVLKFNRPATKAGHYDPQHTQIMLNFGSLRWLDGPDDFLDVWANDPGRLLESIDSAAIHEIAHWLYDETEGLSEETDSFRSIDELKARLQEAVIDQKRQWDRNLEDAWEDGDFAFWLGDIRDVTGNDIERLFEQHFPKASQIKDADFDRIEGYARRLLEDAQKELRDKYRRKVKRNPGHVTNPEEVQRIL